MPPPLADGEVHVWRAGLARPVQWQVLSADEVARARRYRHLGAQRRFAVCRVALRRLLAGYLGCRPEEVEFTCGPHGKPALADPAARLRFNISHSAERALLAFSWDREVGVDLEHRALTRPFDALAARCFSPAEQAEFQSLGPDHRVRGFYNGWTRKEAFIKAVGEGLSHPLRSFTVALGREPALLHHDDPAQQGRWRFGPIRAPVGFSAAVVAEQGEWEVVTFSYGG
jgi:4'-phosphopantetheinyl transferase